MRDYDLCEESIVHKDSVEFVLDNALNDDSIINLAELFKAFGDPTRIRILHALSLKELCVCDIAAIVNISHSATSHQLRYLRNLKLVKFRKEGKVVYYSLNDSHVVNVLNQGIEHVSHE